jgi:hypothetical protein
MSSVKPDDDEETCMSEPDPILLTALAGLTVVNASLAVSRVMVRVRDRRTMRAWTAYFHASIGDVPPAPAPAGSRSAAHGRLQLRSLVAQRSDNWLPRRGETVDGARMTTSAQQHEKTRTVSSPC